MNRYFDETGCEVRYYAAAARPLQLPPERGSFDAGAELAALVKQYQALHPRASFSQAVIAIRKDAPTLVEEWSNSARRVSGVSA